MLKNIAIFLTTAFILGVGIAFSYDDISTHPQLSNAATRVFNNSTNPNKINVEQMKWIEYGASMEDTDPRYVNHFYNPKTGGGLSDNVFFISSAKSWVQKQKSATGDYSYQTTLDNYKNGDKKRAWQGVGHILHLIQDMSVPAHVRIDEHHDGDPYEVWASHFGKIDINNSHKTNVSSLNQVFDTLATYTYDNFLSQDTAVNIKYDQIKEEKDFYGINTLYAYRNGHKIAKVVKNQSGNEYSIDYNVNQSYWNLLAPKAIGYSAGVIELFAYEFKKIDDQKAAEQAKMSWLQKLSTNLNEAVISKIDLNNVAYIWGDVFMAARPTVVGEYEAMVAAAKLTGSVAKTGGELVVDTSKTVGDKLAVATGEVKGVFVAAVEEKKPVAIIDNKIVTPKVANIDEVRVARVIDGDTIELVTGEKVRYIGVDTPELNGVGSTDDECLAWASKVRNEQLIQSGQVRLVSDSSVDKDAYGRLLRYAYAGNTFVNGQLANEGLGKAFFCQVGWNNCPVTSDVTRKKIILDAANSAMANKRGLYSGVCDKKIEVIKEVTMAPIVEKIVQPEVQEIVKNVQIIFNNGAVNNVAEIENVVIVLDDGVNDDEDEDEQVAESATSTDDDIATTTDEITTSTPEVATTTDEVATTSEEVVTTTEEEIDINNVELVLFDLDTSSEDFTSGTTIGLRVDGITSMAQYYLSEYEDGLTNDSIWLMELPETLNIRDGDFEEVSVYLWIRQNGNILPGYILGSIALDTEGPEINFNQVPATSTIVTEASFNVYCADESQDYVDEKYPGEKTVTWNYKLDDGVMTIGNNNEDVNFGGLPEGEHIFSVEAIDRALNISSSSYVWIVNQPPPLVAINAKANHIVISEIQVGTSYSSEEEFIELYNPTDHKIDMSNYRLTKKTKSGKEYNLASSFVGEEGGYGEIKPHGFFLISNTRSLMRNASFVKRVDALYTVSSQSIAADNTIILYSDAGLTIIDKVGYGMVTDYEGQQSLNIPIGSSLERKYIWSSTYATMSGGPERALGNSFDSNNNYNDFIIRSNPDPQNYNAEEEPFIPRLW